MLLSAKSEAGAHTPIPGVHLHGRRSAVPALPRRARRRIRAGGFVRSERTPAARATLCAPVFESLANRSAGLVSGGGG